jgi:translation initiation factor 4E
VFLVFDGWMQDEANKNGGKWIVRLRKGLSSRYWEILCMAMLGEQFMVGEEICGVVVSVRFQEDIIAVWNKTAGDTATTSRIQSALRRLLNLPPHTIMEYKTHNDSLRDNSSFRNTDVFRR